MDILVYPPIRSLVDALTALVGTNYLPQFLSEEALSDPAYPWHSTCALLVLAAPPDHAAVRKYVKLGGKVLVLGAGVVQSANALRIADRFGIDFYPAWSSQDTVQFEGAAIPVSRLHWGAILDVDADVFARFTSDDSPAGIVSQGGRIAVWSCPWLHETLLCATLVALGLRLDASTKPSSRILPQLLLAHPRNRKVQETVLQSLFPEGGDVFSDEANIFYFHPLGESIPERTYEEKDRDILLPRGLLTPEQEQRHTPLFSPSAFFFALDEFRIKEEASTTWRIGDALLYGEVVTSTQSMLDKNPKFLRALPAPIMSLASKQIAGHGRGANVCVSPAGCILMSLTLRVPIKDATGASPDRSIRTSNLVFIRYLFAIAVVDACRTIDTFREWADRVKLIWPNDIYGEFPSKEPWRKPELKKLGEIHVNVNILGGMVDIVVGCELNVLNRPLVPLSSLAQLAAANGGTIPILRVERVTAAILVAFEHIWSSFLKRDSFGPHLDRYTSDWVHSNQTVTVTTTTPHTTVRVESITTDHGLLRTVALSGPQAGRYIDLQPNSNSFDVSGHSKIVGNTLSALPDNSDQRVKTNLGRGEDVDKGPSPFPPADMSGISRNPDHSNRLATPLCVSELEATQYYWGLHSNPRLIARTGGPWDPPFGPEAYPKAKELRTPGGHKLLDVWEDDLALKVHNILDQNLVNWSSTEIVRITYVDESEGNLILWIGIYSTPTRLSYDIGIEVAVQCKRLLLSYSIQDVDVELRESDFVQSVSPALLKPTDLIDPTAIVREPFTTTLGMNICAENTPWVEGTVGFFMAVNGVDKLYGVTARHVLFSQLEEAENKDFERTNDSQPRHNVQLLSEAAFQEHLAVIQKEIDGQDIIIASQESRMAGVAGREDTGAQVIHKDAKDEKWKAKRGKECHTTFLQEITQKLSSSKSRFLGWKDTEAQAIFKDAEDQKSKAMRRKRSLATFLREIKKKWSSPESRILGHVKFSPKITVGAGNPEQQFTQDIAVFEVETSKVTSANFPGNFIDLGTKYSDVEFTRKMHPNPKNSRHFTWPGNRLLKLWGTIPMEEMCNPKMLDQNGDLCITVLKRGRTTNVTVGKVLGVIAYVRKYFTEDDTAVSKELAVIPLDKESGPFSAKGDSGAVVVDGRGRIAGILTGGGGATDSCDVTYVTPIDFILGVIRQCKALENAFIKNAPAQAR